ncbi:bis(5'-adenosyl)-triphosphatase enpp4-like isoform X2 [Oratosquilla oratoria]|uniref:bis(5'-adenosyl)-triphosphatase enpp4-like isoform X2 n=1 Tax=Oratosquilla oratoria TaxID=337810 RepID=UPI003F75D7EC
MPTNTSVSVAFLVVVLWFCGRSCSMQIPETKRKLLVISFDGLGKNYTKTHVMRNLGTMYSKGSYPTNMRNVFVTKTFPNHFTMATGVYEETHGVVGNLIYDPVMKKMLKISDKGYFTQNPNIVPIWTLNEMFGGCSACSMWPGCGEEYHNRNITFYVKYNESITLKEQIESAILWFTHNKTPANLVMLYFDQPDVVGHAYGPDSKEVTAALKKIDEGIAYLNHKLILFSLKDKVDIIIVSDHGMAAVPEENIIRLEESKLYQHSGYSPVWNIWPIEDSLSVLDSLHKASEGQNFTVYAKKNLPDEWHYKNNPRISDIIIVADVGYVFQDFDEVIEKYKKKGYEGLTTVHGDHGYSPDAEEMEPIFVAVGPSFKKNNQVPAFNSTDIYPLMCLLLELPPGPHNGSLLAVAPLLAVPLGSGIVQPLVIALCSVVMLIAVVGVVACTVNNKQKRGKPSADSLINGYVYRQTMARHDSGGNDGDASEEERLLEADITYEI